jgi:hypothetical protein
LIIAGILSYVAACATPAFHLVSEASGSRELLGVETLIMGWLMIFNHQYAWLANLVGLWALAFVFIYRSRAALIPSLIGLLAAQHAWALLGTSTALGDDGKEFRIVSAGPGLFLWMLTFVLFAGASLVVEPEKT